MKPCLSHEVNLRWRGAVEAETKAFILNTKSLRSSCDTPSSLNPQSCIIFENEAAALQHSWIVWWITLAADKEDIQGVGGWVGVSTAFLFCTQKTLHLPEGWLMKSAAHLDTKSWRTGVQMLSFHLVSECFPQPPRQAWMLHQENKGSPASLRSSHPSEAQTQTCISHWEPNSVHKGFTANSCSHVQSGNCYQIKALWVIYFENPYLSGSAPHPCLLPFCWVCFRAPKCVFKTTVWVSMTLFVCVIIHKAPLLPSFASLSVSAEIGCQLWFLSSVRAMRRITEPLWYCPLWAAVESAENLLGPCWRRRGAGASRRWYQAAGKCVCDKKTFFFFPPKV